VYVSRSHERANDFDPNLCLVAQVSRSDGLSSSVIISEAINARPEINQIAYVSSENRIYSVSPAGGAFLLNIGANSITPSHVGTVNIYTDVAGA
jgi:hypothetical protein